MTQGVVIEKQEKQKICANIIAYLSEAYGRTFYGACQNAGVSQREAYTWRDEDSAFDKAVDAARKVGRENATDVAESIIMVSLNNKSVKTAKWFLETAGKGRGYAKKLETVVTEGPETTVDENCTDEQAAAAYAEKMRRRE